MSIAGLHRTALRIQADRAWLDALLTPVPQARGLILLAQLHTLQLSDSRDSCTASVLHAAGFGTLQINMLTTYEDTRDPDLRYDISLLDKRLGAVLTWISHQPGLNLLPLGLFVTDTVAPAAIRLLARDPASAAALCCRAGRPELAGAAPLRNLVCPLLQLMPGAEQERLAASRQASELIRAPHQWLEFAGASAGFIEPGVLDAAARAARDWFDAHLPAPAPDAA